MMERRRAGLLRAGRNRKPRPTPACPRRGGPARLRTPTIFGRATRSCPRRAPKRHNDAGKAPSSNMAGV